ncbi:hypothetical protein Amn_02830 [Aminobacter sp. Y103A]|uniref:hypothetical protein n=1 Tax=Aminobacter sp. Y103A TaxID=1870862 RepID=UPI0025746FDC|nr:hypothetical protein [Aminobacter sp. SS-2016]BBD35403.1 hypothetical protein Amn_02830 [Aminobacter sp. SS-2016]
MIQLFSASRDGVIKSSVALGQTTYSYALENLFPLLNRFEQQRKIQGKKFYARLKKDIARGCIMPPITLAFVNKQESNNLSINSLQSFVNNNIQNGYILDGMQRLNTLHDASSDQLFDATRPLHLNVIIAERYDLLLYRMITLNNGQKPMTARHQIEMLTKGLLDTEQLTIQVVSEKETENTKKPGAFRQSDVAEAYTAFLTDSVNNQNSRIIESKLDEILVGKVMESNLSEAEIGFDEVLSIVDHLSADPFARDWLRLGNNLIGLAVGAKKSFQTLKALDPTEFAKSVATFEESFKAIDISKVNVGKYRRELSRLFIEKIEVFKNISVEDLTEEFFNATLVD